LYFETPAKSRRQHECEFPGSTAAGPARNMGNSPSNFARGPGTLAESLISLRPGDEGRSENDKGA
jgi:hypothetical protein